MRSAVGVGLLVALGGCVYPTDDPTGLELSWRFLEVNDVDGEDGQRERTCEGVAIETMTLDIGEIDDPDRQGTFRFPCEAGYQTERDFQTQASDAFLELHPGDYSLALTGTDGTAPPETLITRDVDVSGRGLTVEVFELARATTTWTLELQGGAACTELSVAVLYADPETALADPPRDEDDEVVPTVYRENLLTDRALPVGGQVTPCSAELDGTHIVENMDRGAYRLEITVDGQPCAVGVGVGVDTSTPIDLANLPCAR